MEITVKFIAFLIDFNYVFEFFTLSDYSCSITFLFVLQLLNLGTIRHIFNSFAPTDTMLYKLYNNRLTLNQNNNNPERRQMTSSQNFNQNISKHSCLCMNYKTVGLKNSGETENDTCEYTGDHQKLSMMDG